MPLKQRTATIQHDKAHGRTTVYTVVNEFVLLCILLHPTGDGILLATQEVEGCVVFAAGASTGEENTSFQRHTLLRLDRA